MPKPIAGLTQAARDAGMKAGGYVPTSMVRWHVGGVHVSTSALALAREYWHTRGRNFSRPLKRVIVRAALKAHAQNQAFYARVMRP